VCGEGWISRAEIVEAALTRARPKRDLDGIVAWPGAKRHRAETAIAASFQHLNALGS
jgi:hypothetical protein